VLLQLLLLLHFSPKSSKVLWIWHKRAASVSLLAAEDEPATTRFASHVFELLE
jgi:hypothetical protein